MSILDQLLSVIVPHDCLSCNREGALLCSYCLAAITVAVPQCYKCLKPAVNGMTCCQDAPLQRVQSAVLYQNVAKDILWSLKSGGMQAAVKPMAKIMQPYMAADVVIVPVPTATTRVRQRGYDQALLLARELSRLSSVPYRTALRRSGQTHQVGASREQRLQQLQNAYHVQKSVKDEHILLIDDVMTTGATLEVAAAALLEAGASRIDALTFARA